MKTTHSLPSLFSQSKLFSSDIQLEHARNEFRNRLNSQKDKNGSEERKVSRPMIHFQQNMEGFLSFRTINSTKADQILLSLKSMKSSSTNLGRSMKAQILFNKKQYAKITDYCKERRKSQTETALSRLAKLEPLPMKKEIKTTEKNRKKIKTTVGIKTSLNYTVYQNNRLNWKPFIDFDAMSVIIGLKCYFIGGRKIIPLSLYNRAEDKWTQQNIIQGLKPFGESEGTPISQKQIVFFGGSRFFVMGESQATNSLTYVNVSTQKAVIQNFPEEKVPSRCFHAQCIYGEFLLISGGIDRKHKLYSNFVAYHLTKKYWFQLTIAKMQEKLKGGFAKHKMMSIMLPRQKYNIYNNEAVVASSSEREQISQQGIYLFGGEDSNVQLSNKIYILRVGAPSIEVYQPKINGTPPVARKNFAWLRLREFLFIHGGRNDQMRPWVLGSLSVLNLKTMNWISVKGDKPTLRHSHMLMEYGNQIVILGGKNMEGLCKEVYPLSFQQVIDYI